MKPSLCTNCKFYSEKAREDTDLCTHQRSITGGVRSFTFYSCAAMRAGICGREGSLFVLADPLAQPAPAESCAEVGHE